MTQVVSAGLLELPRRPHVLYRFFDRADTLLYVGITMDLPKRMGDHRKGKPWWSAVDHITVEHFDGREAVLAAETEAIKTEAPLYNVSQNELVQAPYFVPATVEPPCGEECDDDCRHHHDRTTCILHNDLAVSVIDAIDMYLPKDGRFQEAQEEAQRNLALPEDDWVYTRDQVAFVALKMVENVVTDVRRFSFVLAELLRRLDPAVRADIEEEAVADWFKAGFPAPRPRIDLLPDILRHLGYRIAPVVD